MQGYVNSALVLWLVGAVSMADAAALRQSDPSDLTRSSAPRWSNETQTAFYMRKAIEQAKDAVRNGGGPFGALIVNPENDSIIVVGKNHATQNPIWHGEMDALNALAAQMGTRSVLGNANGFELYTTAEPCAMCAGAIVWAGLGRVVFGTSIAFVAAHGIHQINISAETITAAAHFGDTIVDGGVLSNETDPLYAHAVELGWHQHTH